MLLRTPCARCDRKRERHVMERSRAKLRVGVDIPSPEGSRQFITHLQARGLRDRWRPLFLTAIFTGLRASELRGLTWEDVDLPRAVLHVRQRADRYLAFGAPKSRGGERSIPLPPRLIETLREWKLQCPKGKLGLVFPTGNGTVEYHQQHYRARADPRYDCRRADDARCRGQPRRKIQRDAHLPP